MAVAKSSKAVKTKTPKVRAFKAQGSLELLSQVKLKTDVPQFRAGDKVVVRTIIKEGDKERIQNFEGVCIARKGRGIAQTFTVRKMSFGVGVERVFPLHSPLIAGVDVGVEGFVRRAKLHYLRELTGKKARIQDRRLKLAAAMGATVESAPEQTPAAT